MCRCPLSWVPELWACAAGWSLPWRGPGLLGFAYVRRELEYMAPVEKGSAEISATPIPISGYSLLKNYYYFTILSDILYTLYVSTSYIRKLSYTIWLCAMSYLSARHAFYHLIFTTLSYYCREGNQGREPVHTIGMSRAWVQMSACLHQSQCFPWHTPLNKVFVLKVERKLSKFRGDLLGPRAFHFLWLWYCCHRHLLRGTQSCGCTLYSQWRLSSVAGVPWGWLGLWKSSSAHVE